MQVDFKYKKCIHVCNNNNKNKLQPVCGNVIRCEHSFGIYSLLTCTILIVALINDEKMFGII